MPETETFRLRGLETTRLDTFIDAAFSFGATVLLITAGQLPKDYAELTQLSSSDKLSR